MSFLRRVLAHIVANAAALYFVTELLSGNFVITGSYKGYLIAAVLFGILNGIIKPILKLLSLPFILISAGVFILVINVFLVWFAKYALDILQFEGVQILIEGGPATYLYAGLSISIINMIITWLLKK
ncbi:phage holin family protein [Candidatus Pacearchaeota archaeon]|nr:phage holin family protein [Candidatus Pacearchaeota archaeon]